jgi:hypothetical protein
MRSPANGRSRAITRHRSDLCRGHYAAFSADPRAGRDSRQQLKSAPGVELAPCWENSLERIVHYAVPFALAAVAVVLLAGLWNMLRGGSPNLSQKLMRWRVILQFIAIIVVMAAIYLGGKFPM